MADPGVDIEGLKRGYEAFSRRDWDAVLELYADQIEWRDPEALPDAGVQRGKPAVRQGWERFAASFEQWELEPVEMVENGEHVIVRVRFAARGRESGADVSLEYFQVWTFEGGRVVLQRGFADRPAALRAAGLEPDRS